MTNGSQVQATAATSVRTEALRDPLERLRDFLQDHRVKDKLGPKAFADFERELHERVMAVERDIVAAEMQRFDVDAEAVVIEGKTHRRVLRQSQTYLTTAGEVVVDPRVSAIGRASVVACRRSPLVGSRSPRHDQRTVSR